MIKLQNSVFVRLEAEGVGRVDVLWESDGQTRDTQGGAKMFTMEYGEQMQIQTYEDHVFRITEANQMQKTLTSCRIGSSA